ncbi:tetrahydrobiopterin biosynthesis enzymes-like protein [Thozetella sp. PMI_491]|nr:tetrahydrobiopterin biosynthesis enzymes-like protein [Thozetella sp. PMI_491]
MPAQYSFTLERKDLQFAASHFTHFGPNETEELHGHNFFVKLRCTGSHLDDQELLLDIFKPEEIIRRVCGTLNNRVLLAEASPLARLTRTTEGVDVKFANKSWRFPREGVVELPMKNLSCEALARYFWKEVQPALLNTGVERMAIGIEELDGVAFWYEDDVVSNARF